MNFDFGWLFNWLGLSGDKAQLLIAGALGGIIRWMTLRDHWSDGLISMFVGAVSAMYLAPLAVPSLVPLLGNINVAPENVGPLSGFLIGIGGITVSGFFIDAWRLRRKMLKADRDAPDPDYEDGEGKP
jgi:hypothetical protein